MAKIFGYGSAITVQTTTAEIIIGQVRSISGPGDSMDDVDVTCLDSTPAIHREFAPGLSDPGTVDLDLIYDSGNFMHKRLVTYQLARYEKTFKVYPGSTTGTADSFKAYVKDIGREIPLDDLITATLSLKVSGEPGYQTT